ncbi:MAG: hypothetical protein AB1578_12115 [Thermodesulfobacteriota bacterium]
MTESPSPSGLTREEWNVAYFLGLEEIVCGDLQCDFDGQIRAGAKRLAAADYRFEPREAVAEAASPGRRPHERSCRELCDGTFDVVGRARETLHWLALRAPRVSRQWLERLLACYDRTHGEPAPVPSLRCAVRAA